MGLIMWLKGEEPSLFEKVSYMFSHGFDTGSYGEYLTEYMFGNDNLEGYSKTLHNIYIPYRGKTSEIDVLLIHEKGLFVIESKNYSGWMFGSAEQKQWTQVMNKNTKNRFYNPVMQNATHINALSKYLGLDKSLMMSFIVFSERCELKKVPDDTSDYIILRRHHLLRELRKEMQKRENVFSDEQIRNIYGTLVPLTNVSDDVKKEHIEQIERDHKTV